MIFNNFEEGSNGAAVTPGSSSGSGSTAFDSVTLGTGASLTYDTAQAAHGSLSCNVSTAASVSTSFCEWSAALGGSLSQAWFRGYYYFTANPSGPFGLVRFLTAHASSQVARVALQASGHLTFNDGANTAQILTTAAIPLNAWFRLEGFVTGSASAGQLELRLFSPMDAAVASETDTTGTALNTTGTIGAVNFGITGTALASETYWLDDTGVSGSGYLGPVAATSVPPFISQFNGMF